MTIRRLSIRFRRAASARSGMIAFGVALVMGLGFGLLVGRAASRSVFVKAAGAASAEAQDFAFELREGLAERKRALRVLSRMPSVVSHRGAEKEAFRAFRSIYPEFERVGTMASESTPASSASRGPRALRLIVDGPKERVFGTLRPDWPNRIGLSNHKTGRTGSDRTTILVGRGGTRTPGFPEPADSVRLASLADGGTTILLWSDGERYMTALHRIASPASKRRDLAVVSAYPMERLGLRARQALGQGLLFGAFLGIVAGAVAWVGVSRSTRRLRAMNDVLERRVAERTEELAAAERSFRGIFENVPFGLYHCDREGRFLRVNATLAHTLGYETPDDLIVDLGSLRAIGETESRTRFLEKLSSDGEVRDATTAARTADGRTVWLAERARAVRNESGEILFIEGAIHDVSAQRELETQLRLIGETDALTGLLNRRGLTDAIASAQAPISFITLDVDRFKAYNDTYGHPAGDRALQSVAAALRATVRESDTVARAGGEEFVVVLSRTGEAGAKRVAEALRSAVERCGTADERLTVSGGVATAATLDEVGEAFSAADRALYKAKEAGRNRIVVNSAKLA